MDEARTRRELIDRHLAVAGWRVGEPSSVSLEFDIYRGDEAAKQSSASAEFAGHQFVDYLLLGRDGSPACVVEAKRTSKDAEIGREQALQYAQNIVKTRGGAIPFVMYTNGFQQFFWDTEQYPPTPVHGYPTREDIEHLSFLRSDRRPLSVEMINTSIAGRPYQIEAIRSVLEAVERCKRKFLLVMATGTGKTRTCAGLVDVLMRARWAKRVLFLVDRIALRDQALDAFKEHLPDVPVWPQQDEKEFVPGRRAYVATYPAMLNVIRREDRYLSPFYFDLIVADESHRSIYNTYRQVLDYFYCLRLGLTATPTDRIDHDTFKLFECDAADPTFAYSYQEAVENVPPYLCDFEVLKVRSKFQLEGIKGETLTESIKKKLVAEGLDLEDIDFEGSELERRVTNAGTNRLIVTEFMEECIKDPSGVLPGKTIFFAISKAHAFRLESLFNTLYPEHKGRLARVLISEDDRVYGKGGLLDQFRTQDMPRIAISVDMLDTGVDVREVVNLVFAKPVYSFTKFWQMIGRGTRVLDDDQAKRKPWCTEKDRFLIIDCWGNFEYFKMNPKGKEPGQQVPAPVRLFRSRLDQLEAAIASGDDKVVEMVKTDLAKDIERLPENNVVVLEKQADLAKTREENFWLGVDADKIGFLRGSVAPILRARSGDDPKALRFENDVVELSAALLADNKEAVEALQEIIVDQVSELPLTINTVAAEKELITTCQTPHFWATLDQDKIRSLALRLPQLMGFRQRSVNKPLDLDIEDIVAIKEVVEFGPERERASTAGYRAKLEARIAELLEQNAVLQKLKAGMPVSEAEIEELARILQDQDPYVTEEILRKVYDHKSAHFIQFIRHILGLERLQSFSETVTAAFVAFIAEHNDLAALQIQFLQTLRTFILQTGAVEKRNLVEAPFTNIHPDGVRGVFSKAQIDEVMALAASLVGAAA